MLVCIFIIILLYNGLRLQEKEAAANGWWLLTHAEKDQFGPVISIAFIFDKERKQTKVPRAFTFSQARASASGRLMVQGKNLKRTGCKIT